MPSKEKNKQAAPKSSERYYAFFDAEYTCFMNYDRKFDRNHSNEVISIGLVIADHNFDLVEEYYTPICPKYNPVLTKYCKELTGLTQKEISEAPSFEEAFHKMDTILQNYQINMICVWGNDRITLEDGLRKNHPFIAKRYRRLVGKVTDITKRLTQKVFGYSMSVSLADMKFICGMEHLVSHNALEDARDLYQITRTVMTNRYKKAKVRKLEDYVNQRDTYHRHRRFRRLWPLDDYPRKKSPAFKAASEKYIQCLKDFYKEDGENLPAPILAICDDIRNLSGMDARDCPKLIDN